MDTEIFDDDDIFDRCMGRVSDYRRDKVMRLRFRNDKKSSLAAGVLLSYALGTYMGIDERACTYAAGEKGKPYIVCDKKDQSSLHFSLSHTDGLVGVIVGSAPCGIDVESIKTFPDSIVERIFSVGDRYKACLFSNPYDRDSYCTRVWTRREAYGKLTGDGLLMNDETQRRVMDDEYMKSRGVMIQNLETSQNDRYMAAACVYGSYEDFEDEPLAATFEASKHLVLSCLKW